MTAGDYFKTRAGTVRLLLVGTGILGVTAVAQSPWVKHGSCSDSGCPFPWLAQVGISFVVISLFFDLIMLAGLLKQNLEAGIGFKQLDSVGHKISGVVLIIAFAFFTTFVVLGLLYSPCDNEKTDIQCKQFDLHRGNLFQPILFGITAVLSFVSGIIALYFSTLTGHSEHSPLPGVVLSSRQPYSH